MVYACLLLKVGLEVCLFAVCDCLRWFDLLLGVDFVLFLNGGWGRLCFCCLFWFCCCGLSCLGFCGLFC